MMRSRFLPLFAAAGLCAAACSSSGSTASTSSGSGTGSGGDATTSGTSTGAGGQGGSGSTSASTSTGSGGGGGSEPKEAIHLLGRFDTSDPQKPAFAWPGSAIATRFSGTGVDVMLHDDGQNFFAVSIDGAAPTVLATGSDKGDQYPLAQGLSDGEHDLLLFKRTESFQGVVHLLGFAPAGGKPLVPTPPPFKRHIELIGDSITCGYGNQGMGPNCGFTPDTEDEWMAWGAISARSLSAEAHVIAYSGQGVYRDNQGNTTDPMPVRYERTFADDPASTWDFTKWTADVVVINLGTNDFAPGDPGQPYADATTKLVKQIRGHYPQAFVILAVGTMLSDGFPPGAMALTKARGYLKSVVSAANSGGDTRVSFLDLGEQDGNADGLGCDYHPSVKTDQLMADKLTAAVKAVTGW